MKLFIFLFASLCSLSLIITMAGSPAAAQQPGDILWSVQIDHRDANIAATVGPDGTLYVHSDVLYAITPEGTVAWSTSLFDIHPVSVGADGTIYTGTNGGITHAYNPDGSLRWTYDSDSPTIAGPTVGPDGSIYVVAEAGLGAYSLTSEGALRWNLEGFADNNGTAPHPIPFSNGQFYHSTAEMLPDDACGSSARGMVAVSLEGQLQWCVPLTNASHPAVSPAGDIYVTNGIAELRSYNVDGELRWFFGFPNGGSSFGLLEPAVGPDGDAYQFLSAELWGTSAQGDLLWNIDPTDGNVISPMLVSPNDSLLLAGFARSGGQAGELAALNPATGAMVWSVTLAPSERVTGRAVFSNDGDVVYVPVSTFSESRMLAIQVSDNGSIPTNDGQDGPTPGDLSSNHLLSGVYPNPSYSEARFTLRIDQTQEVTISLFDAVGRRVAVLHDGILLSEVQTTFAVDGRAFPSGVYHVHAAGETFSAHRTVVLLR